MAYVTFCFWKLFIIIMQDIQSHIEQEEIVTAMMLADIKTTKKYYWSHQDSFFIFKGGVLSFLLLLRWRVWIRVRIKSPLLLSNILLWYCHWRLFWCSLAWKHMMWKLKLFFLGLYDHSCHCVWWNCLATGVTWVPFWLTNPQYETTFHQSLKLKLLIISLIILVEGLKEGRWSVAEIGKDH